MGKSYGHKALVLFALVAASSLFVPATSRAQLGMDKDPFGKVGHDPDEGHRDYGDKSASSRSSTPEPYGGQIFCPVSGHKLGVDQPAVPVQTTIGEEKPSGLGKLFRQKAKPGVVIYACCPACAEQIRNDPQTYFSQVVAAKAIFVFKYATAPGQIPPIPPVEPGDPHHAGLSGIAQTPPEKTEP
jgi:hypothetical protein